MTTWLKQSTATDVELGPFVDDTDGKTAETGLTISQADCQLIKNGGAAARATDPAAFQFSASPVVIGPSTTCFINLWWLTAAANAPVIRFTAGFRS